MHILIRILYQILDLWFFSTNRNADKIDISVNGRYLKILLLLYNLLL